MKERIDTNPPILHFVLKRNKNYPNSKLPVIVYRNAFNTGRQKNKAARLIQKIFAKNGWSNSWRNGIYDFHHYHSTTHECMGIAAGSAQVVLGGPGGKKIKLSQGDVIILPAGAAHKRVHASESFLCVGSYPQGKDYDINVGTTKELKKALPRIHKLALPLKDPVFGKQGFLKTYWK